MSLYPISTACPKCGANAHQVCKTGSVEACDERWIAAGAHVIDGSTTNPETAGVEPVACLTCLGFGYLRKAPSTCSAGGDLMPCPGCCQSPGATSHPAPASNTTSVGGGMDWSEAADFVERYDLPVECIEKLATVRVSPTTPTVESESAALAAIRSGSV